MADELKQKSRVSYPADLRKDAKAAGQGMITVSVTLPDGTRDERQLMGNAVECRFARWAAAMLQERNARPLPDLEKFVTEFLENQGAMPDGAPPFGN